MHLQGLSRWCCGKESACQCRKHRRHGFNPWVGKIPCSRRWQPTPIFLPGESHGQRSLVDFSPWAHKELDMTEQGCMMHNTFTSDTKSFEWFCKNFWSSRSNHAAAAAAKSLQSCLTLCDPIDGSPPGFPIPWSLQARTLEWVAISSSMHESEKWKWSHSVMSD